MQPSSLIFLVIIGIWAAYFVQYWVRRREHLATIRSVDAFSETMRVLQLRAPLSTVDTGSQAPRTYAVSPARAMRPQVTVKRADASTMLRDDVATSSAPSPSTLSTSVPSRPRPMPAREVEPEVATMRPGRATRGIVLVVGLLGTLVFGLLAAFGVLVAWSPLVPLAMAGAGFGWLRAGVQAEVRARREAQRPVRRPAAPRTSTGHAPVRPAARAATLEQHAETEPEVAPAPVTSAPFDVSAHTSEPEAEPVLEQTVVEQPAAEQAAAVHEVAVPVVDEDDIPLTWDPRPVPRPTYTMKAKAPDRSFAAPQAQPEREDEHTAYDELPERRISGL